MRTPDPCVVALPAALACTALALAVPPQYDAPELQVRGDVPAGFNLPADTTNRSDFALNDDGTMSIWCRDLADTASRGLWYGTAGVGEIVYAPGNPAIISGPMAMNPSGLVVWPAFNPDTFTTSFLNRYDPGPDTTTWFAVSDGLCGFVGFGDDGRFGLACDDEVGGVFAWRRGLDDAIETLGEDAVATEPRLPDYEPSSDSVAGLVAVDTGGEELLHAVAPGDFTLLAADVAADAKSPIAAFLGNLDAGGSVDLTADGVVVFTAELVAGGNAVVRTSAGGPLEVVASGDDAGLSGIVGARPAINAAGQILFRGLDDAGLEALYLIDNGIRIRVIGEDDLVPTDLGDLRLALEAGQDPPARVFQWIELTENGTIGFSARLVDPDTAEDRGRGHFVVRQLPDPADLDGDGTVGLDDLILLLAAWGAPGGPGDLDDDGIVGFEDLILLLSCWD